VSAAAVIMLRRKKFIRGFVEQGATSPDEAIPFTNVRMRRSWVHGGAADQHRIRPVRREAE
jgi:hypothetical protein